jgi:glucose uptake protein
MRESGMAVAISLSAILQLLAAGGIAMALFGKRPSAVQLAGMGLGVLAVALIVMPSGRAP